MSHSPGNRTPSMLEFFPDREKAQELLLATCSAATALADFANEKYVVTHGSKMKIVYPPLSSMLGFGTEHPYSTLSANAAASARDHPYQIDIFADAGHYLRYCADVLCSSHAGFAIRVASAVLCSQLPAFLSQTQRWYNHQRVVWASITVRPRASD